MLFNERMVYSEIFFEGIFLNRNKRFFVECEINNIKLVAHCPNTGSMDTCLKYKAKILLSYSKNPARTMPFTLEMIKPKDSWVFVNTLKVNKIIQYYLINDSILKDVFKNYQFLKTEPKIKNHKLDLLLFNKIHEDQLIQEDIKYHNAIHINTNFNIQEKKPVFIEIKNVTYYNHNLNCLQFPDAKTKRGLEHLNLLDSFIKKNFKSYLIFVLSRQEGKYFKPAHHIDPAFSNKLYQFNKNGGIIIPVQLSFEINRIEDDVLLKEVKSLIPIKDLKIHQVIIKISNIKNIQFD